MGGLARRLPVTFWTMVAATLAIAGIPPLSGFFSKDEIVWGAFAGPHAAPVLGVVAYTAAFLTAFYMGRLLCVTFLGECRASEEVQHHVHESPWTMLGPLVVLAALAVGGGFLPVPRYLDPVLGAPLPGIAAAHAETPAPLGVLALATLVAAAGLALAYWMYVVQPAMPWIVTAQLGGFYRLVRDKFRVDELYDGVVVRPLFALAGFFARVFDPAVVDGAVNGAGVAVAATSALWRRLQTGNVQHYALSFLLGAIVLVAWFVRG
jgi:NADH-quinone oxidoreductase subunit L